MSCNPSFLYGETEEREMRSNYIKKKGTKVNKCPDCDIKYIGDGCPYCYKQ